MSGSHTLSSSISNGITLTSNGAYRTPFTVTASGTIESQSIGLYALTLAPYLLNAGLIEGSGATAVTFALGGTIINSGAILGGPAAYGSIAPDGIELGSGTLSLSGTGGIAGGLGYGGFTLAGDGGTGIYLAAGSTLINGGPGLPGNTITGGAGGASSGQTFAGYGGYGLALGLGAMVLNAGSVSGGAGGYSQAYSGDGGVGAALGMLSSLVNLGVISGGQAGDAAADPGIGGDGASLASGASLSNAGLILGGAGMSNGVISSGGGLGVYLSPGAYLANAAGGIIRGGSGGGSTASSAGGAGVAVLSFGTFYNSQPTLLSSASLVNFGGIYGGGGGYAGPSGIGGGGGTGVDLDDFVTFTNAGTIAGGAGGVGGAGGGNGGFGVAAYEYATLINQGLVEGGAGGAGPDAGGGLGVVDAFGAVINNGSIQGGAAGYATGGTPGEAGFGVAVFLSTLINTGGITGGQGAGSPGGSDSGGGAAGVIVVEAGEIVNSGSITGAAAVYRGTSNAVGFSGGAGGGIYTDAGGGTITLYGTGTVTGGAGYSGAIAGGTGGYGVLLSGDEIFLNGSPTQSGNIVQGGAGGDGTGGTVGGGGAGLVAAASFVYNNGALLGGAGGANLSGAGNGGAGGDGAQISSASEMSNLGIIIGGAGGASADGSQGAGGVGVYLAGALLYNAGTIAGGAGFGGQADAVTFSGSGNALYVAAGAVFGGNVVATYGASDVLGLSGIATLSGFGSQFTGFDELNFLTSSPADVTGSLAAFAAAAINGFAASDTLDLTNLTFVSPESLSLAGDVLTVTEGTAAVNITFSNDTAPFGFTITSDGAGGTDITTAICYLRGTRILTPTGERPVEALRIGDALVTRFGGIRKIRWIGEQKYDWRFVRGNLAKIPVRIAPGALGDDMPARELAVSPGHSLLLGETLILARDLVNGSNVTQEFCPARDNGVLEYYQIEFDTHDCVIAEGAFAESYADAPGQRAEFHNAESYHALYPDTPPVEALSLCAERPQHGRKLAQAVSPVVARAWAGVAPGPLEGWVERVSDWFVEGWAFDPAHPALPVMLEVRLGEHLLGVALAHEPRADLAAAAKGSGRCAFRLASPVRLGAEARALVSVRRLQDGAELALATHARSGVAA